MNRSAHVVGISFRHHVQKRSRIYPYSVRFLTKLPKDLVANLNGGI